ncbi:MAG: ferritin-like domain-containing protein [Myxococcales bacterium]|nr:ferritin-like domain-containing protein [Myxococcales bacterium]
MATTQPDMGINRTGIGTSPRLSGDMIDATKEFRPSVSGDERQIAYVRGDYAREADKLGSVPPPPTAKGMAKTALQGLKSARPVQFIDKLGERLGFERSGVRVYEALISKFDHTGGFEGGPERMEVEQILREEFEHFRMLEAAIKKLGGDPTALTPSANFHATMTSGVIASVVDPRTSFAQCLEAALLLELADNDCWDALVQLADRAGQNDMVADFEKAIRDERDHLLKIRTWLAVAQGRAGATNGG